MRTRKALWLSFVIGCAVLLLIRNGNPQEWRGLVWLVMAFVVLVATIFELSRSAR